MGRCTSISTWRCLLATLSSDTNPVTRWHFFSCWFSSSPDSQVVVGLFIWFVFISFFKNDIIALCRLQGCANCWHDGARGDTIERRKVIYLRAIQKTKLVDWRTTGSLQKTGTPRSRQETIGVHIAGGRIIKYQL